MAILMKLTPNQRLDIIKIMTANAWPPPTWPQIWLYQMLMALKTIIPPTPTTPLDPLYPFLTTTLGLQIPQLLGTNNGILSPPPAGANTPPQQSIYGMPYMEAVHNPRPSHPPLHFHPYAFMPPSNCHSPNLSAASMPYRPPCAIGPIRNRRQAQVLLQNGSGDVNLYSYDENCDDDNSSMQ